jgi:hypothetical protein
VISIRERLKQLQIVTLGTKEQETLTALIEMGYVTDHMLTIAIPLQGPRRNDDWLKSAVYAMMAAYHRRYHEHPQWLLVLNRGTDGLGEWSGHIVWKNKIPAKLKFFTWWWNKRFGSLRAVTSHHDNCLAYAAKNMAQPDARTHDGPYNRRNAPRRGAGHGGGKKNG